VKTLAAVALLLALTLITVNWGFAQDKIRISYSSRSYTFLPAYVAQASGFFRDENLDVELIQMRPGTSSAALYNGDVFATLTFGSTIAAIVSGFPFKVVAVLTVKPIHYLVARPEIQTIQDLKGKRLGVSQLLGTDEFAAYAILDALGLSAKDVKSIALGDEAVRREALRRGMVDASAVAPPGPIQLAREGFRILGGPTDVKIGSPSAGLTVTEKNLKERPDVVRKLSRALLRSLRLIHDNGDATKKIMSKWLNLLPQVAADSYQLIVASFSLDGEADEITLKAVIEARRKSSKVEKEIPLEQIVDFRLIREVRRELGL
jgi:ABC-type nitrate/sulfonate/bicarbonate transport system substrate-binding protein